MQKNKQSILGQIIRIDNSLKIKKCNFTSFKHMYPAQKLSVSEYSEIEDYKQIKEAVQNMGCSSVKYRKLAFQPVKVISRR